MRSVGGIAGRGIALATAVIIGSPVAAAAAPDVSPATPVEDVSLRTETSKTFRLPRGFNVTEVSSSPIHHLAAGGKGWLPLDVRFSGAAGLGRTAASASAPVRVSVAQPSAADGFLALEGRGHAVRLRFAGQRIGQP